MQAEIYDRIAQLVYFHHKVKASRLYNFQGCKVQLPSKFDFGFIECELQGYSDYKVVDLLKFGFPVDCTVCENNPGIPKNHKGATDFQQEVQALLEREVRLGGILGPFTSPPFSEPRFSPLNSVPKRDTSERRLILDLLFLAGSAINDGIHKDWYLGEFNKLTLPSLDDFVAKVMTLGIQARMFKVDLSRGYKQMYIDPLDFEKMGFKFGKYYYFDCTLSVGSRSSARCCQRVTNAVVFIYTKWGYFAINYLDDLGGVDQQDTADIAFATLRQLLTQFGLTEALNKACSATHVMVFLGIEVNSNLLTMRIPGEKMLEILSLLDLWTDKEFCSITELQSLAGSLNFAARCVRSGRVYLSRILNFLRTITGAGLHRIPRDTQRDIKWWKEFFPLYNGVSLILNNDWSEPDKVLASDSCLTGGGAYTQKSYMHFTSLSSA